MASTFVRTSSARPRGDAWLQEMKIDGHRIELSKVRLLMRHANDWTVRFRPIASVLAGLKVRSAYLDGEDSLSATGLLANHQAVDV